MHSTHLRAVAGAVALVILSASGGLAADTQPLTIENIQARTSGARQAAIAPDGRSVAAVGTSPAGDGIHLVPVDGSSPPVFWTAGASPVWFPDSRRIVLSRDGDLWVATRGEAEARRVTSDQLDERAASVSPDGETIAFFSGRGGAQDIWLVPAAGGTPRQLTRSAMAADDFRFTPSWSPDGRTIAYVSNGAGYWDDDVWLVEVATGRARQLTKGLMAMSTPAWSPDGKRLALLGTSKREFWYEDLSSLYVIDAGTGAERTVDMQVYATDWLHSQGVFWSPDGAHLRFVYMERGDFNVWSVPAAGGVATRLTSLQGAMRAFEVAAAGTGVSFIRTTPTRGSEVEYVAIGGGRVRQLTRFAAEWEGISEPTEIAYRSFDGLYIQGFLYLPPGFDESKRYPALVQVHGGGTNSYLRGQNLVEHYLASRGYVVLAINYRGGSGFGREFQDLGVNDWVNGQAHDAAMAADFLRSLPYVSGKVGIYGYSYGGIMTLGTIARHPGKFDAAVPMAGIYDFADAYENADRLGKIFIRTGHGGSPADRPEVYAMSNTLARVAQITTPLLIMHGEADVRAPFRQYQLAVSLLEKHGKTFESKSYPNEPHGFRRAENRIDMYRRLEAFFDRHLKPGGASGPR